MRNWIANRKDGLPHDGRGSRGAKILREEPNQGQKPSRPAGGILLRMLSYLRPVWYLAAASLLLTITTTAIGQIPQLVNRYLIDHVLLHPSVQHFHLLMIIALGIFGLRLVSAGIGFARSYVTRILGQHITYALRRDVQRKVQYLSTDFYIRTGVGQIMSRVMSDTNQVQNFVTSNISTILNQVFTFVIALGITAHYDRHLTLLLLLFGPPILGSILIFSHRLRALNRVIRKQVAQLNTVLHDALAGFVTVKAFSAEEYVIDQFEGENLRLFGMNIRLMKVRAAFSNSIGLVTGSSAAFFMLFGGDQVLHRQISLGTYFLVNSMRGNLFIPFTSFANLTASFQTAAAGAERIFEFLDTETTVQEKPDAITLPPGGGEIAFKQVSFAYPAPAPTTIGDEEPPPVPAIHDLSFTIAPGEMVGLVGRSGSGKTTIAHLIPRFYDCQSGTVRIDGHDVRDVTLRSLRSQVTVVLQDTYLFNGTVRDNVAFALPDATPEAIDEALRAANADFVRELPQGLDTILGEGGMRLSGGQRQRIAVARALLRKPRVLVLDEATSAQDNLSELAIFRALRERAGALTMVVIAHRLSTVSQADRILVLEDGRLVEEGRHTELLARGGAYAQLYGAQDGTTGEAKARRARRAGT